MKLLEDYKDIDNVGEILVQCFVGEKALTESSGKLLLSKSMLLESAPRSTSQRVVVRKKWTIDIQTFITAYVDFDHYPTPSLLMQALGVPLSEWTSGDIDTHCRNTFTRTVIPHFRGHVDGQLWLFPDWGDRKYYSETAPRSIHPNRVGEGHGIKALDFIDVVGDPHIEKYDVNTSVDRGERGRKNKSSSVIDTFNKAEIASGEFYNNISRITPSVWGRVWQRETSAVKSDRAFLGKKWKKVFVVGYQIDKTLLYEIWYGTMDGLFTLHDKSGNQLSRKFPTMTEVTRALTNAIVQTSAHDATIFNNGGASANKIAASIVKTLNTNTDSMVDDLLKIDAKEMRDREAVILRKAKQDRDAARKRDVARAELKAKARYVATHPLQSTEDAIDYTKTKYDNAKTAYDKSAQATKTFAYQFGKREIDDLVRAGKVGVEIATLVGKLVVAGGIRTREQYRKLAADIGQSMDVDSPEYRRWAKDLEDGKIDLAEFIRRVEKVRGENIRNQMVKDGIQRDKDRRAFEDSRRTQTQPNDNDKAETVYRETNRNKVMGYKGMSTKAAIEDIQRRNLITPPYRDVVNRDTKKVEAYILMLLNTKKYSEGRSYSDEVMLITYDAYGYKGAYGTVNATIKRLMDKGSVVRENYVHIEESNQSDQSDDFGEMFNIDDELDSRRDSTIATMRRNSERVAMTVTDLKNAVNDDLVELYSATRIDESKWKGVFTRILNSGRKVPIALPTDKPSIKQRVKMFFQGSRYRADFVTGVSLVGKINVEVWYVTEPNPNAKVFDAHGILDAEFHGRATISSFYVFDVTSGTLVRKYLPYHKNALQVAMAKLGVL